MKNWKKGLALVLALVMLVSLLPTAVWAEEAGEPAQLLDVKSGTCGAGLTWSLDTDTGVLTISGTGDMDHFAYAVTTPWRSYVDAITTVVIEDGVTSIGQCAFAYCASLTDVTIPEGVTTIKALAFDHCTSLTDVTIPEGVTTIEALAFDHCTSLTAVSLPQSLDHIGAELFYHCTSLTAINVSEGNAQYTSVDGILFNKNKTELIRYPCAKADTTYSVPDSVKNIAVEAFSDCSNLAFVNLPDGLETIEDYAFAASGLRQITIPASVTTIYDAAFADCANLTTVNFLGDAPLMGEVYASDGTYMPYENIFADDTLQARYPANNATWTDEVKVNYGGEITWQPMVIGGGGGSTGADPYGELRDGYVFIISNHWTADPVLEYIYLIPAVNCYGDQIAMRVSETIKDAVVSDGNIHTVNDYRRATYVGRFCAASVDESDGVVTGLIPKDDTMRDFTALGNDVVGLDGNSYEYDDVTKFIYVDVSVDSGDDRTDPSDDTIVFSSCGQFDPEGWYKASEIDSAHRPGSAPAYEATAPFAEVKATVIAAPGEDMADYVYVLRTRWLEEPIEGSDAINTVLDLKIINNYPDGTYHPDLTMDRASWDKMAYYFATGTDDADRYIGTITSPAGIRGSWAEGYASYLITNELDWGDSNDRYYINEDVTLAQACRNLLAILGFVGTDRGYTPDNDEWEENVMADARRFGLMDNLDWSLSSSTPITRRMAAELFFRALEINHVTPRLGSEGQVVAYDLDGQQGFLSLGVVRVDAQVTGVDPNGLLTLSSVTVDGSSVGIPAAQLMSRVPGNASLAGKTVSFFIGVDNAAFNTAGKLTNASGFNGMYSSVPLSAMPQPGPATNLALNKIKISGTKGQVIRLEAATKPANSTSNVTWTSNDPTVASVNEYGEVTCLKAGETSIKAAAGEHSVYCSVTVLSADRPSSSVATYPVTGNCGVVGHESDLTWTLDRDGTLTITGEGAMADYDALEDRPWDRYRSLIKKVVLEEGVQNFGVLSFADLPKMTALFDYAQAGINTAAENCLDDHNASLILYGDMVSDLANLSWEKDIPFRIILPKAAAYVPYEPHDFLEGGYGYTVACTKGAIPKGLTLTDGVLAGIPAANAAGEHNFTLYYSYTSDPQYDFEKSYYLFVAAPSNSAAAGTVDQGETWDEVVWNTTEDEYQLTVAIPNQNGTTTNIYDEEVKAVSAATNSWADPDMLMKSKGEFEEFVALYLDGRELKGVRWEPEDDSPIPEVSEWAQDVDYYVEEGSTAMVIRSQTLSSAGVGTHTLSAEFRKVDVQGNESVKTASQNYTIPRTSTGSSSRPGGGGGAAEQPKDPETAAQLPVMDYVDVPKDSWFYADVEWAFQNGYLVGTGDGRFSPEMNTTCTMLTTVLARLGKVDLDKYSDVTGTGVEAEQWYTSSAVWAWKGGIVGDGTYAAQSAVTRGDMAVMLVRFLDYLAVNYVKPQESVAFADADQMTPAEEQAFQVLYANGIMKGVGGNAMSPAGTASRAELATVVHRLAEYLAGK